MCIYIPGFVVLLSSPVLYVEPATSLTSVYAPSKRVVVEIIENFVRVVDTDRDLVELDDSREVVAKKLPMLINVGSPFVAVTVFDDDNNVVVDSTTTPLSYFRLLGRFDLPSAPPTSSSSS